MAPFNQHPGGPGHAGMNGPGGPAAMNGPGGPMNIPGGMGGPGGPGAMIPGGPMGPAGVMNGQRRMPVRPNVPMGNGMNMGGMAMRPGGGMQTRVAMGAQNGMPPNLAGQGGMLGGQMPGLGAQGGMPGQANMSLPGGQANMGGLGGQGPMGGMPNLGGGSSGMNGPSGMSSMGNGPNPMSMGGNSGMPGLGPQGGMPGPGSQGNMSGLGPQPIGSQPGMGGGMGNVMPMAGGGGGMPNMGGGGGMNAQPGAMGGLGLAGQVGLGGPSNMGPGAGGPGGMGNSGGMNGMGSMGLNGMGPSGGPGMSGGNGLPGANGMLGPNNRQWPPDRPFPDDLTKRPASAQLEEFGGMSGNGQHGLGGAHPGGLAHGGPQHGPQPGQQGVGGPQHGVGGAGQHGIGAQHGMGAPQQPPGPHAGSPVNGAHHPQHHPVPTHLGQGPPGHMGPGGTPRMNSTPVHAGAPPHMPTAPSPHHHMGGSPAHHPNHPHQPHHLVDSPAHQMSSPRHMTSSSPAPRSDGLGRPGIPGEPGMMRMNDGMMMRGPDGGQMRPSNDMMMPRDGRIVRDGMLPMERAPSTDGMMRPGVRPEIGRLGPDGTMIRGSGQYGQPPYGAQGPGFGQPPAQGYVLTPAQQHQNMQMRTGGAGGAPRVDSVDDMPNISDTMGLPNDMGGDMMPPGAPGRRTSMPPQMMNGPGSVPRPNQGPVLGPGGPPGMMAIAPRRPTMSQARPINLGMGIVRMLQMSHEMCEAHPKSLDQWAKFRNEYFMPEAKIFMTIFQGVEGRKYEVAPQLIARFFLTFFESGVAKMSIGLNGAQETVEDPTHPLNSAVETIQGVWRYELSNGWVVEHSGPLKINMSVVTDQAPVPGEPPQYKLKIVDLTFSAPIASYLFKYDHLEGNRISGQAAPMTPRISPGLAARKTDGGMGDDPSGSSGREEEALVFENARLPPKPFPKYGLPENVWRLLVMSTSVHELVPLMELAQDTQAGPLGMLYYDGFSTYPDDGATRPATLDQFAELDREARMSTGLNFLPEELGGHQFPNFVSDFGGPSSMPHSSPALTHPHPGMHNPQGSIGTTGRPTPTPPLPRTIRNGQPLAGAGDLPPVPPLSVAPPGMMMQQSPSLTHQMPPGQMNGQVGVKRKLGPPDQGLDAGGPSAGASQPRLVPNGRGGGGAKSSPVGARKKAKTNVGG
ncbi:hypothetical protein RhiJN_00699 [Ceratobasidium sp. AG-Ba]|nr:hypothetical protein RhiJN_00699 [Ceratobasidium sp. AG-Ba]